MQEEQSLAVHEIDCCKKDGTLPVMPNPPLMTSDKSGWNSVHFAHFHQPAWELPEFSTLQHTIIFTSLRQPLEIDFELGGRIQKLHYYPNDKNCIELFPANLPYKFRWHGEIIFTHFYLDPAFVSQVAHEAIDPDRVEILCKPRQTDPLIYNILQALKADLESDGNGDGFYADSLATAMSAHLLRHYAARKHQIREYEDGLSSYKLKQAIEYLNEHLGEKLSLEAIALELKISQYYFCRLFKQSLGISPHQYLIQQRVERAKQLLRHPELTVTHVAMECGFANHSHFAKYFRQRTGISPKQFRKI